jgi:RNA polymerase sigma factor (sigma-70 family)
MGEDGAERSGEGRGGTHIIGFMPGRPAFDAGPQDPQQAELETLVARMATGDEGALARFYDATISRVYGLALRICGSAPAAEEVTTDVYYQCWNEATRYDARRSRVTTWLLVICRSRAIDELRARDAALLHEAPETLVEEGEQPRERAPEDLLDLGQSGAGLHAALARLGPAQRQMIGLAFFRGLSHQEIAAHTGLPLGTVKSHIRRALELLRRDLQPGRAHGDRRES